MRPVPPATHRDRLLHDPRHGVASDRQRSRYRPCYSYVQPGLRRVRRCLASDRAPPRRFALLPLTGAAGKLS